jgi:hypothetical protein
MMIALTIALAKVLDWVRETATANPTATTSRGR